MGGGRLTLYLREVDRRLERMRDEEIRKDVNYHRRGEDPSRIERIRVLREIRHLAAAEVDGWPERVVDIALLKASRLGWGSTGERHLAESYRANAWAREAERIRALDAPFGYATAQILLESIGDAADAEEASADRPA